MLKFITVDQISEVTLNSGVTIDSVLLKDGAITPTVAVAVAVGGTGATTAPGARTNLGLGGAAVLNVGTTSGTVAAGDDSRFTDGRTPTAHASTHISTGSDPISAVVAAGASGLMTGADKTKLDGIAAGATNYTHPANHAPSIITQDTSNRFVTDAQITSWTAKQAALGFTPENAANKGAANGYASLDSSGLVPSTQLPSYVDDIIEAANMAALNALSVKETGKIYVALDTNKTYRWSGSAFVYITSGAVDSVNSQTGVVVLTQDNVASGTTNKVFTATEQTKLAGIAAGANLYVHPNHSGDVTSVADGATTIAAGAVTLVKMANMATASLIYRKTTGTGAPEVQTLATLKTDLGLTGTNSGDQTLAGLGGVAANTAITAGTATKITYDAKGLVTAGAAATTADIADSTNKRYCTDAQKTVISNTSGTNTGDETSSTIKTKLGITTLSGSNTGDQTLSGLGGVATTVTISTTAPLTGGGDLSANRTLALSTSPGTTGNVVTRTAANTLASDVITEITSGEGVSVDGVLIKDNTVRIGDPSIADASLTATDAGKLRYRVVSNVSYCDMAMQISATPTFGWVNITAVMF